eukprot:scaffold1251_cov106-Skeletonema_marinoi.AAC.2
MAKHDSTIQSSKLLPVLTAPAADTTNRSKLLPSVPSATIYHHTSISDIVEEDTTTNNLSRILSEEEDITIIW